MTDYSLDSDFVKQLDQDILNFIHKGLNNHDEERFNELALREFELQYHTIKPYREYCLKKGVSPESASKWEQIPAVPSLAFKKFILTSFPFDKAEHAYFTSGTTDPSMKGKIFRDKGAVKLINAANGLLTKEYVFPDVDKMKILLMTPSPEMAPNIGMAVGLDRLRIQFSTSESTYLISKRGLDVELLLKSIIEAEKSGNPLAIIGSTSGFIYFLNACEKEGLSFNLPKGSRICDGGGYMGQFGECSREEYLDKCKKILGIDGHLCINVLGMGEISTNFFDNVLKDYLNGIKDERYKVIPPWTRTEVVDINNFQRLPKGGTGLLKHYDLVNRAMVMAVQTDNLGYEVDEGFEIIGRWKKKPGKFEAEEIKNIHGSKIMTQMVHLLLKKNLKRLKNIYNNIKESNK